MSAKKSSKKSAKKAAKKVVLNGQPVDADCKKRSEDLLTMAANAPQYHYAKGLPHDARGKVDAAAFREFVSALKQVNAGADAASLTALSEVPKGVPLVGRNMVNPLSGWSTDLEISDPCCYDIPEPPEVASAEEAAELIELYWMALLRDLPFVDWQGDERVIAACNELSGVPLFIDPARANVPPRAAPYRRVQLTPATLFRGGEFSRRSDAGLDSGAGPYVSQFLLKDVPYGTQTIRQVNEVAVAGIDYMVDFDDWLDVQRGAPRNPRLNRHPDKRYIATMRDLASYVHFDQLFQPYLNAALILLGGNYPATAGNPYGTGSSQHGAGQAVRCIGVCPLPEDGGQAQVRQRLHPNQDAFGTFGGPHVLSMVTEVAQRALKAVWRTKWTHLRIRPEGYAGLVHRKLIRGENLDLGAGGNLIGRSEVMKRLFQRTDAAARQRGVYGGASLLLPMAFPEGSPTHPSYGAGHATVAAACVTVLKAFFEERAVVRNPVLASRDGLSLEPYTGGDANQLTVLHELEKLACNVSNGRNIAGVHWRSDSTQSFMLGQRVAVDMLVRQAGLYREDYRFEFTSFGGKPVVIAKGSLSYDGNPLPVDLNQPCDFADTLKQIV